MKVLIIGGVAGGASTAARLRRLDETAEIIMLERGSYISFANCGLPYYIGDVIKKKEDLVLQTPESFKERFNVDVRILSEATAIDPNAKIVTIKDWRSGDTYQESYDKLVLSPGAEPVRPALGAAESQRIFTLRNIPDTYKERHCHWWRLYWFGNGREFKSRRLVCDAFAKKQSSFAQYVGF